MFDGSSWLEQVWNLNQVRIQETPKGNRTRVKSVLEPSKKLPRNLWPSRTTHAKIGSYGYKCKLKLMPQGIMDLRNLRDW